jgi:hypothetical protein
VCDFRLQWFRFKTAPLPRRRPEVHKAYPKEVYDRTTPEWVDGNFYPVCNQQTSAG